MSEVERKRVGLGDGEAVCKAGENGLASGEGVESWVKKMIEKQEGVEWKIG